MSYVGSLIHYLTDPWISMWPVKVDSILNEHDAPLVPGYSMLLALSGRDVKPMSKPSDAWLLYRYLKLCGMLKIYTLSYFNSLCDSVHSAMGGEEDFPHYYHAIKRVRETFGNNITLFVPRGLQNFLEILIGADLITVRNVKVSLIRLMLDNDGFLRDIADADITDIELYKDLAEYIDRNKGDHTSEDCLGAFAGVVFALHWMRRAVGSTVHARPPYTYLKTTLEFYIEEPRILSDMKLYVHAYDFHKEIRLHAYFPRTEYNEEDIKFSYGDRADFFESYIDDKKKRLLSMLSND